MITMQRLVRGWVLLSLFGLLANPVLAGPQDPVRVSRPPEGQGAAFVSSSRARPVSDLPREYVEEEFFVEGRATLFNYGHNPPQGPTDIVPVQTGVPYKTRLILRRPADPDEFDGTVVVEWWNSTSEFDNEVAWVSSANYFAERGIAYVGVTNSTTSLNFLTGGCRLFGVLPPACGTRYATLSLPENGLAYEMMSQIANLLRSDDAQNPLPSAYRVKRLFHVGQSQQGGSVITYASAFHLPGVNNGYFIQSAINARPINFGPRCGDAGAPAFPACTPRLPYPQSLVRTDLPVPVFQVVTQTDFETSNFNVRGRQPDRKFYRYYEIAGGAHNNVHKDVEVVPAGLLRPGPIMLEDFCANEMNTAADGPVYAAYVLNALWSRIGRLPPAGVVMDQVDGVLQRDRFGNVTGGVRLPALEVPTARYGSPNVADPSLPTELQWIGNLACRLSGSVFPFDQATLEELYPEPRQYVLKVVRSTGALSQQGFLLEEDARRIVQQAQAFAAGL
jgi:hypothetical protein